MKLHLYDNVDSYPVLLLTPKYNKAQIHKSYIQGYFNPDEVLVCEVDMRAPNKALLAKDMKEYVKEEILPLIGMYNIRYVLIAQGDYFKHISGENKTDVNVGYLFENHGVQIGYLPLFTRVFYDPDRINGMIKRTLDSVREHAINGTSKPILMDQKYSKYLNQEEDLAPWFKMLHDKPELTVDVEAFSLKPFKAGIGTISFAWNQSEGIVMDIEYSSRGHKNLLDLKQFFEEYKGKCIYHNASYDISVLIATLFMNDVVDADGLLKGIKLLMSNFEDTKLIAYLATNTCAGNNLGLKTLAQPFAGNYANDDIHDITKIPLPELMKYNLVDTLSTWYVYDTYYPIMVSENQLDVYLDYFKPFLIDIIQMQLTGFPLDRERSKEVGKILEDNIKQAEEIIHNSPYAEDFLDVLRYEWIRKKDEAAVKKKYTYAEAKDKVSFNTNSGIQLGKFLFDFLKLPVMATTPTGLPSTDKDSLNALLHRTEDPEILKILNALLELNAASKILTTFIPAFLDAEYSEVNKWHYLTGSFNLGGTVSGRLSSSNVNLQQLPSKGKYGKLVKSCFKAPPGKLLIGLDFASLEDRISALLTKDVNKVKVYTDGYDGHALRAYSYFSSQMTDIRQAEDSDRCFMLKVNGQDLLLKSGDFIIDTLNNKIPIEEFFNANPQLQL